MTDYTELLNSVISIPEAAAILGVTDDAVRMAIHRKTLTARKMGEGHHAVWIIPRAEVEAWAQRRAKRNVRMTED